MQVMTSYKFLISAIVLALLMACTPPTPPPSPTPWPSATPEPAATNSTPQTASVAELFSTPPATPSPQAPLLAGSQPVTITVWESLPGPQAGQLAIDIETFETEFPQYQVILQHYNSPESFMPPLIANQIEFDVVLASPVLLGSLWAAGQLTPVSDLFSPGAVDNFEAGILPGASRNGQLWGLPETAGFHLLLFYNRALVDTPPTNTADMVKLAEQLTTENRWGLGVNSYDPLWVTPWLAANGGWLTDESGRPTLNTGSMAAALALHAGWQAQPDAVAPVATYEEVRAKFLSGNLALLIDGEWAIGELADTHQVAWGVALLPGVGQAEDSQPAAPLILGRYWAVSRQASGNRAQAAAAFVEFMTRPERQLAWTAQFGLLPTRREALNDPQIINDPILRVSAAQMQAGRTVPLGVNANLLLDAMRDPLQAVIDGNLTPSEAAEMMQKNVEP